MIILSDVLAFTGVIYQLWGLWKLRQSLHLRGNGDIVSTLLRQGTLRFCFVILVTIAQTICATFAPSTITGDALTLIQNVLSTILICEFTLGLRQRNAEKNFNQSAMDLPTLSFQDNHIHTVQSMLGRLHESIITEMGERDGFNSDNLQLSDDLQDGSHGSDTIPSMAIEFYPVM
ncbi:hypothetical protein Clacol_003419 [Clathrus columnatus]|uniref:Uncharacterized protein n=1 Tax=Clathrus columnatus TaxID=1419009 RepID=A0AAV5A3K9_9AGAM|nr:hypothetical protein Clacol_003419 [Clathrus columnatus]